jgi:hypothetical protein
MDMDLFDLNCTSVKHQAESYCGAALTLCGNFTTTASIYSRYNYRDDDKIIGLRLICSFNSICIYDIK